MCGITGFISTKQSKESLANMTSVLTHRGPDASGLFYKNNVGLGHRRLSIIDLSEAANQPLHSSCNRYVMVYNGEVYNFSEIKLNLLKTIKINFKTHSDTEVLLEAFALWGQEFVQKLNGMFTIAIWDKQAEQLYLFRDRIGIKPLYYYLSEDEFIFSSELKSLQGLDKKLSINKSAIASFLHLGYIPSPQTIYNDIHKFPSGTSATIELNEGMIKYASQSYWTLSKNVESEFITDEKIALRSLNTLIEQSVQKRMVSDVPFGTFLSGGIDSSLVTAIASQYSKAKLNTFSIGFEESTHNESQYAAQIAQYLNTNHHEFILSQQQALPLFEDIIDVYDEPYADSSAIPTMLLASLTSKEVKMTLTGDGGDELFHGYGMYDWANRLQNPFIKPLRNPISWSLQTFGNNRLKRAGQVFKNSKEDNIHNHIFSQEQYLFSNSELTELLIDTPKLFNYKEVELIRKLSPAESQAFFDLNYYLQDDLLVKVDRASMQYGLECRVPLLDHDIIEFALNLSPELKKKGSVRKHLLQEVLFSKLPKKMFQRPKQGFSIPLVKWLKNELSYLIDDYLNPLVIEQYNIVQPQKVKELIIDFRSNKADYLYNRIWVMIILHKWLIKKG